MALAFRAASTTINGTLTKPGGVVEGDIMLLVGYDIGSGAMTAPSGWLALSTPRTSPTFSLAGLNYWQGFYKIAGASEPASYSVQSGTRWLCSAYSGGNVLTPYEAVVAAYPSGSTTSIALSDMTPTSSDTMYVAFVATVTTLGAPSLTFPPDMTVRSTVSHTNGADYVATAVADRLLSTAGVGPGASNVISTYIVGPATLTVLLQPWRRRP
jgi:hypothetical protein